MKKIMITTVTLDYGGAEKVAVNLANQLMSSGYNVTLLVLKSKGPLEKQVHNEVDLIYLNVGKLKYGFWRIVKQVRKLSPDIIISNMRNTNIIHGFLSKFQRFEKVIFREATTFTKIKQSILIKQFLLIRLLNFVYSSADLVIANSNYTGTELIKFGLVNKENIVVIGNPVIDLKLFHKKADPSTLHPWFGDDALQTILFSGRLHTVKNLANLINAFKLAYTANNHLRLVIIGDGPEREKLISLVRKLTLEDVVAFTAFCDNPLPFYKSCDVFVLPSKWEGFGNVLVEAVSCGAPIIVNDCPGGVVELAKQASLHKITNCNCIKIFSEDLLEFVELVKNKRQPFKVQKYFQSTYEIDFITRQYIAAMRL